MRHFRSADTEGKSAERAVGRCVAVAATISRPGRVRPCSGPDQARHALPWIVKAEQPDAVVLGVLSSS